MLGCLFLLIPLVFGTCASQSETRQIQTVYSTVYQKLPISIRGKHEFIFQIKSCNKVFLWFHSGSIDSPKRKCKIEIAKYRVSVFSGSNNDDMSKFRMKEKRAWPCSSFTTVRLKWDRTSVRLTEGCNKHGDEMKVWFTMEDYKDLSLSSEGPASWKYGGHLCNTSDQTTHNTAIGTGRPCDPTTNCQNANTNIPTGSKKNRTPTSGGSRHPNKSQLQSTVSPHHGQSHNHNPTRNTSARDTVNLGIDISVNISQRTSDHVKRFTNKKKPNGIMGSFDDGNVTHTGANMSDKESYLEGLKNISDALGNDGSKVTSLTSIVVANFLLSQIADVVF